MQIAIAMPRRRENHCEVSATSGAKVAEQPSSPISTPCARLNCHRLVADPATIKPTPRNTAPMDTGTSTPKRSDNLPIRTPPRPKPIIASVYGSDASPRATANSAWMRGSTTLTVYMPEPPIVISTSETKRRVHAYGDSMSCAVAVCIFMGRGGIYRVPCICANEVAQCAGALSPRVCPPPSRPFPRSPALF